jgi:hypothetical protein
MEDLSSDCILLVLEKANDECLPFFGISCAIVDYLLSRIELKTMDYFVTNLPRFILGEQIGAIAKNIHIVYMKYQKILVTDAIALKGNIEVLKYAHKKGYKFSSKTLGYIIERGSLEMVKYMNEETFTYDYTMGILPTEINIMEHAARGGHLDIIKYYYNNGLEWYDYCSKVAANRGHLNVLEYVHKDLRPLSRQAKLDCAYSTRNIAVLEFIHSIVPPSDTSLMEYIEYKLRIQDLSATSHKTL